MRSETHWSYGNWIAWGLGMAWALGITALGASHAPLAQQGGAQFGQFFGPLCVIGLAAMALLKRRYLELGEKGLVDCSTLITHTYAYENIQRVASFRLRTGAEGVIVIDCEVGGVIRRATARRQHLRPARPQGLDRLTVEPKNRYGTIHHLNLKVRGRRAR